MKIFLSTASSIALAWGSPSTVLAQDASASAATASEPGLEQPGLGEIVVTATRAGATNVQDVSIAITALSGEQIQDKGITTPTDLQFHVPNLSAVPEGSGFVTFGIRGINIAADNFQFDSAVGVYLNEVYVARTNDVATLLFDVDGLEVLRGPQGTTFGRNTPTGAILIRSRRPKREFGGYAQTGIGGRDHGRMFWRSEAAVDVPVAPSFALRIAGAYDRDGGYGHSVVTGYHNNSKNDYIVRGTLDGDLTDNLKVTVIGEHSRTRRRASLFAALKSSLGPTLISNYDLRVPGAATPFAATFADLVAEGSRYTNRSNFRDERNKGTSSAATLIVNWDISGSASLRSITGYRELDQRVFFDPDATEFPDRQSYSLLTQKQISQEFVFNAKPSDRVNVLAGLFLFREKGAHLSNSFQSVAPCRLTASCLSGPAPNSIPLKGTDYVLSELQLAGRDIVYKSLGVYTNLSWEFLDGVTAAAGIRLAHERKGLTVDSRFLNPAFPVVIASGPQRFTDDVVLYDGKLTWKASDDTLVYLKYGTGYRAGGIGFLAAGTRFDPETVKTWEAGAKLDFDVGAVPTRVNLAAFRSDYKSFQIPVVLANPQRQTIINAGEAIIKGLEAEVTMKPLSNFDIGVSVGLLDAKYKRFTFANASLAPNPIDFSDNRLRRAPKLSLSGNAAYSVPLGDASDLLFQVDVSYQSGQEQEPLFQRFAPLTDTGGVPINARTNIFHIPAYAIVNGLVKWHMAGSGVDLSVWAKNITDKHVLTYSLHVPAYDSVVYSEPRSYGVTIRKSF